MTESSEDRFFARDDRPRGGSVLIIGVGSVGSYLADELAHLGIRLLSLVDKEELADENIVRHVLQKPDVGKPKATTLAKKIREDFPPCTTKGLDKDFLELDEQDQLGLINQVDLVVGATDDDDCQRRINELCVRVGKPAVYPAFWSGDNILDAEAGHVLRVVPGERGPCYACAGSWLPRGVEVGAIGGNGTDIRLVSDLAAKVVIGILHPDDVYASLIEEGRTAILVHALYPPSDSIAHLFAEGNTRPVRVSLPPNRCPVCGGQEARPPQPTPPSAPVAPPISAPVPQPAPPRPVPAPLPQHTPSRTKDLVFFVGRAAWLLGAIGVLLFLLGIDGAVHLWTTSNVLKILFFGGLDLAVIVFGLWLTFHEFDAFYPPDPVVAWGGLAIAAVFLVIGIIVLAHHNGTAAQASPDGQGPSAVWQPGTSGPSAGGLPETASTAFTINPTFNAQNLTVTGVTYDSPGDAISVNLTPSLHGFELEVRVSATYTASDIGNLGVSPSQDFAHSCMDISLAGENSPDGSTYYEGPVAADLSQDANGTVSGTLVYGAVLPGSYRFDLDCLSRDGQQGGTVLVGTVSTPNVGIVAGTGDNDNALVVFTDRKSSTDTAVLYGAIGATGDGSEAHPTLSACIVNSPPQQNPVTVSEGSTAVDQQLSGSGNGQWFELGVMTFNLSASQLSGPPQFFYDCSNTNGGGLSLP